MNGERGLIAAGTIGAIIAAICCATPLLVVLFGALGVTAWVAHIDSLLIAALVICFGLIALGFYLRHRRRA